MCAHARMYIFYVEIKKDGGGMEVCMQNLKLTYNAISKFGKGGLRYLAYIPSLLNLRIMFIGILYSFEEFFSIFGNVWDARRFCRFVLYEISPGVYFISDLK